MLAILKNVSISMFNKLPSDSKSRISQLTCKASLYLSLLCKKRRLNIKHC